MSADAGALLERELAPGETVLWQGAPRRRAELLRPGNWLFALCWIGFSIGWTLLASALATGPASIDGVRRLNPNALLPAIGLVACLGGLILLIGPIVAVRRAGRTLYAITDRRLLRIVGGTRTRVLIVPRRRINSVVASRRTPGWGTIRLSATTIDGGRPVDSGAFYLRGVPDVATAHALLAEGVALSLTL